MHGITLTNILLHQAQHPYTILILILIFILNSNLPHHCPVVLRTAIKISTAIQVAESISICTSNSVCGVEHCYTQHCERWMGRKDEQGRKKRITSRTNKHIKKF